MWADLLKDDAGATAIEYALIAGMVAFVVVAGMVAFAGSLGDLWSAVADTINGAIS